MKHPDPRLVAVGRLLDPLKARPRARRSTSELNLKSGDNMFRFSGLALVALLLPPASNLQAQDLREQVAQLLRQAVYRFLPEIT